MVLKNTKYQSLEQQLTKAAAKLTAAERTNFKRFFPHFMASFSMQDIDSLQPEDAYRHAYALFRHVLAAGREKPHLHIYTPSQKTYIYLAVSNMPFVVASLLNIFVDKRIYIHSQQNFVINVTYHNQQPSLVGEGEHEMIVIRFVVEPLSKMEMAECHQAILSLCHSLRRTADDWRAMEKKLDDAIAAHHRTATKRHKIETNKVEFIHWLKPTRYIMLGCYKHSKGSITESLGICHPTVMTDKLKRSLTKITLRQGIHFTKTHIRSIIHRPVYLDMISISTARATEYRFLILYAFNFYNESIETIPYLGEKFHLLLNDFNAQPATYRGRVLRYAVSAYPRDQLVQILERDILREIVAQMLEAFSYTTFRSIIYYDERYFFANVIVVIPREDYDSQVRNRMEHVLNQAFGTSHNEFSVLFTEMRMALVFFTFHLPHGKVKAINHSDLIEQLRQIGTSWERQLRTALLEKFGEQQGLVFHKQYQSVFPPIYKERFSAQQAGEDLFWLTQASKDSPHIELNRLDDDHYRLRIFDDVSGLTLSNLVHLLENSGVDLIASRFYIFDHLTGSDHQARLIEFRLSMDINQTIAWQSFKEVYQQNITAIYRGQTEDDGFNSLSRTAAMPHRYIGLLRAWTAYLAQVQGHYGRNHIEAALCDHPACAQILIDHFVEKFSPKHSGSPAHYRQLSKKFTACLEEVSSLEQDQIIRQLRELIIAMDRTNFYLDKQILSFKIRPSRLSYLAPLQPQYEIFVYAPDFEGVHLRAGPEARGGIRWSDRQASYRLEIYRLLRAQIIKNSIIIPTGAKGGFYIKNSSCSGDSIYRQFIGTLLELTDNLGDKKISSAKLRIYDNPDPYLVVAPDKGTAAFSDLANEISYQHNYWLGDAFASSGSSGYNHKDMGITARGAWESVWRHFAEMGIDASKDPIEVIGVGDMSGDVFGNGMLLAPQLKLIAAFNHRHIFIDPNPDPASALRERRRLYNLPYSSWQDYKPSVLSPGGAIFSRQDKKLSLSQQIRKKFAIREQSLTPNQLISHILSSRADLLWFGGIGTYIKAGHENNTDAGDKTNDSIRVNANQVKARVIGEGANLGMTMAARIELAAQGSKVATDANDNSGGVHCSDREVNIKILLSLLIQQGKLKPNQRNRLLKQMTDEVAEQVLAANYTQNLLLSIENWQASQFHNHHVQVAQDLDVEQTLQLASNGSVNQLTKPQLSMLIGHYKNTLKQTFAEQPLIDHPQLRQQLPRYYPKQLIKRAGDSVFKHPLANRILATSIVNDLVDHLGFALDITGEDMNHLTNWAQYFYQLDGVFSFTGLQSSLSSQPAIYPQILPLLHSSRLAQLNALRWLKQPGLASLSDKNVLSWRRQIEDLSHDIASHSLFSDSYHKLNKLDIEESQAAMASVMQEMDSLIILLPLINKDNRQLVLELYNSLHQSLSLSKIKHALDKMQGQNSWQRTLAQDMWLSLGHQINRIIKLLLAKKTTDTTQLMSEWQSVNQLILKKYHLVLPQHQQAMDGALIQFLIGLLSKLRS